MTGTGSLEERRSRSIHIRDIRDQHCITSILSVRIVKSRSRTAAGVELSAAT